MKRYYLDVITGTNQGGSNGIKHYEVEADTYSYSQSGCYTFHTMDGHYNPTIVVASYPINRTIIKRIEEI
jgi:hypothetical protein